MAPGSQKLVALAAAIRYNAPHPNLPGEPDEQMATTSSDPGSCRLQEGTVRMLKKAIVLGIMVLLSTALASGLAWAAPAVPKKMLSYDYSFKPGTEPEGFRGIKRGTDIATLDPLHTMEVIAIVGPFTYYKKLQEDLHLVNVKLDDRIYEFWNGKFSGVIMKVKGERQFQILRDYCFARFGEGQRSKILQQMNVPDYYYNGLQTHMYLKYNDFDHEGELSLYSIAMLAQQQKVDTYYYRERAKAEIEAWEKAKGKK
jgi:hypothetical protein